ncbi:MAG: hypothetical protein JWN70_4988 [Planctomycetaceae bacterium]|nr:hypothetical protein [Planctomycetaceae bacterium]
MPDHRPIQEVTRQNVEAIARMEEASINSRTFGEQLADQAAKWVGSWTFLMIQSALLVMWMIWNVLGPQRWDAYPFVLLNLVLSFQAAFATPVILMSENRQARLSERRNQLDLQVNLLAEQENTEQLRLLRLLCEKAGIDLRAGVCKSLEEPIRPNDILEQIAELDVPEGTAAISTASVKAGEDKSKRG